MMKFRSSFVACSAGVLATTTGYAAFRYTSTTSTRLRGFADYREPYRPQFHFTPPINWMNDPNGMVHYDGEWHLFYQHNPHGNTWGHMSWGHAVSKDLVHWENLPIALKEEDGVMIFSGSAVVDWVNTSGFGRKGGTPPLVAIYTGHGHGKETQDLAFSNDRGRTWTKYRGNPVLDIGEEDFRDPKVIWHEPTKRWIMAVVLARQYKVQFYGSADLRKWTHLSDFGPVGAVGGIWECPDLFPIPVVGEESPDKWALLVNLNPGAPAGGSGTQYFVGDFDGRTFTLDPSYPEEAGGLWLDHGPDSYAAVTWSDVPEDDGRRIAMGWMSNWLYSDRIPTNPWRGAMTLPRELRLHEGDGLLRLMQRPVRELEPLRQEKVLSLEPLDVPEGTLSLTEKGLLGGRLEIIANFKTGDADEFGFRLFKGGDEVTVVGYDELRGEVFVDRSKSGEVGFDKDFAGRYAAPLAPLAHRILLRIFVDESSVEVFGNDGLAVLTTRIFASAGSREVEIYSKGGATRATSLLAWKLKSIWHDE